MSTLTVQRPVPRLLLIPVFLCLSVINVFASNVDAQDQFVPPSALGGDHWSRNADHHMAMTLPRQGLDEAAFAHFMTGVNLFEKDWREAGGGPAYNALACQACHPRDGRPGKGLEAATYIVKSPTFGGQIQTRALPGSKPDAALGLSFAAKAKPTVTVNGQIDNTVSLRQPPPLAGLGLLAAIPDQVLAALEKSQKGSAVSGRRNRVLDPVTGKMATGRFGWKAGQPHLMAQTAKAAAEDMGLDNALYRQNGQARAKTDITVTELQAISDYVAALAVPRRRLSPESNAGYQIFTDTGCATCHQPQVSLGGDQLIWPFTDLLLHDMGPGLADDITEGVSTGSEWRTPPLWGIGLLETVAKGPVRYLHDGRAESLETAIDWHGGEAETARQAWQALADKDRQSLLAFLRSL